MLPPPAPIVFTSTIGARTGYGPMNPPEAMSGFPPLTTATEALVLAEGRVHLGGEGHADLRRDLPADLPGALLVRGIDEGEEIAHRDGLRAVPLEGGHLTPHLLLVERHEHAAAGVQALADAQ